MGPEVKRSHPEVPQQPLQPPRPAPPANNSGINMTLESTTTLRQLPVRCMPMDSATSPLSGPALHRGLRHGHRQRGPFANWMSSKKRNLQGKNKFLTIGTRNGNKPHMAYQTVWGGQNNNRRSRPQCYQTTTNANTKIGRKRCNHSRFQEMP